MKIVISSADAAQLRVPASTASATAPQAPVVAAGAAAGANDPAETELVLPALQLPVEPVLVMPEREVKGWFWSVGKAAAAIVAVAVTAALLMKSEPAPTVPSSSHVAQLQDANPVQPPKAAPVKRMENRKAEVEAVLPPSLPTAPAEAKVLSAPASAVPVAPEMKPAAPQAAAAAHVSTPEPAAREKNAELLAQVDAATQRKLSAGERATNMTPGLRKPESADSGIVIEELPQAKKSKAIPTPVGQIAVAATPADKQAAIPAATVKPQPKADAAPPVVAQASRAPQKNAQTGVSPAAAPQVPSVQTGRVVAEAAGLAEKPATSGDKRFVLPQVKRQSDLPVMPEAEEPADESVMGAIAKNEVDLLPALPSAPGEERTRDEKTAAPKMVAKGMFVVPPAASAKASVSPAPKSSAEKQSSPAAASTVILAPEKAASHPKGANVPADTGVNIPAGLPDLPGVTPPAKMREQKTEAVVAPTGLADAAAAVLPSVAVKAPVVDKELNEQTRASANVEKKLPSSVRVPPVPAAPIAPVEMPEIPAISAPALPGEPVAPPAVTSAPASTPAPVLAKASTAPVPVASAQKKESVPVTAPSVESSGGALARAEKAPVSVVTGDRRAGEDIIKSSAPTQKPADFPSASPAPAVTQTELTLTGRESAQQLLAAGRRLYEADAVMRGLFAIDEALEKGLQDGELEEALTLKARMELKLRRFSSMQETIDRLKPVNRVAAQALEMLRTAALSRMTPAARQAAESAPPPPPAPSATPEEPARERKASSTPQGQSGSGGKRFAPNTDPYYR